MPVIERRSVAAATATTVIDASTKWSTLPFLDNIPFLWIGLDPSEVWLFEWFSFILGTSVRFNVFPSLFLSFKHFFAEQYF